MTLPEAKELVFKEKPKLAELYKNYLYTTWLEYAKATYPHLTLEIKSDLLDSLQKILLPLLGKNKTKKAIKTLKQTGFVSTADHHGILCHPFFSNNTLLRSHPDLMTNEAIISFACGGVSISNSSYPRGIFFHDQNLKLIKVPFISLHTKHLPIYGHPALSKRKFSKEVEKVQNAQISANARKRLNTFFEKLNSNEKLWELDYYSDQCVIANDDLWETLFENKRGNLIYIELETLMKQVLLDTHLEKNTVIHQILFDKTKRDTYIKAYENVIGAHDSTHKKGTHLFWYIDRKSRRRKQLWIQGNYVIPTDKSVKIQLTPDAIREELENYNIFPSMAFCYSTFAFYYGITLGGGFSQIQYLGDMKRAYQKVSSDIIDTRTDIFTGEYIAVGVHNEKDKVPASLLDILLYADEKGSSIINSLFNTLTIGKCLDGMMPEFVQIITGNRSILRDIPKPHPTFHVNK